MGCPSFLNPGLKISLSRNVTDSSGLSESVVAESNEQED